MWNKKKHSKGTMNGQSCWNWRFFFIYKTEFTWGRIGEIENWRNREMWKRSQSGDLVAIPYISQSTAVSMFRFLFFFLCSGFKVLLMTSNSEGHPRRCFGVSRAIPVCNGHTWQRSNTGILSCKACTQTFQIFPEGQNFPCAQPIQALPGVISEGRV